MGSRSRPGRGPREHDALAARAARAINLITVDVAVRIRRYNSPPKTMVNRHMHLPRTVITAILAAALLAACGQTGNSGADQPESKLEAAARISKDSIIVDSHIDVPYRLKLQAADVSIATEDGDFDYPRAIAGGLNAPFMSIYTPATLEAENGSKKLAEELIDMIESLAASAPEKFAIARSVADVRTHFEQGLISFPMGMENGSPIEGELANLAHFHKRGIRYITLAHSLSNHISDSSYDDDKPWHGLSGFGVAVVLEMNRLGIMIDVSHISDDAFRQVLEISKVPVIASHSSARSFTPGWERNMDDAMIKRLAEADGVIMINFGSAFLTEKANVYSRALWDASDIWKEEHPELSEDDADKQHRALYEAEHGPYPFATLDDVLDHIDHVVEIAGVDHVGIGSDYDGVGDSLPSGLKDVSSYPNLVHGLLERGYSEVDIRKILGENLLRVWQAAEDFAQLSS